VQGASVRTDYERRTGIKRQTRIQLPAAQDCGRRTASRPLLAFAERQFVSGGSHKGMCSVKIHNDSVLVILCRNVESQAAFALASVDAERLRPSVRRGHE